MQDWVVVYLVNSWPDLGTRHESFDLLRAEVADANTFDQALFNALLQGLPGF